MLAQTSLSSLASSPLCFALLDSAPHLLVSSSNCDVVARSAAVAVVVVVVVVIAHDWHFLSLFWLFFSCYFRLPLQRSSVCLFTLLFTVITSLCFNNTRNNNNTTTTTAATAEKTSNCSHQWQMKIDFCRLFISDLQLQLRRQSSPGSHKQSKSHPKWKSQAKM